MITVVAVEPADDFQLKVRLSDGREGLFDVTPYLGTGVFQELRDPSYFRRVKAAFGGVVWPNEQDFSPETIECELRQEVRA